MFWNFCTVGQNIWCGLFVSMERSMRPPGEFKLIRQPPMLCLSNFLASNPPTFPTSVQLISAGDSDPQNTKAYYRFILSHFCCALSSNFNHPRRIFSQITTMDITKPCHSFEILWPSWTCTLAIRWFCNSLSWLQPLCRTQMCREQSMQPFLPQRWFSSYLRLTSHPAARDNRTEQILRPLDSEGLGLNLNASTMWLCVLGQDTWFFQESMFSSVKMAAIIQLPRDVLGIVGMLFVKALFMLLSTSANSLKSLSIDFNI